MLVGLGGLSGIIFYVVVYGQTGSDVAALGGRRLLRWPWGGAWRAAVAALLVVAGVGALVVWGGDGGASGLGRDGGVGGGAVFRYVNSGWVSPLDWEEVGPFSQELRAFVIVSQGELEAFESGFVSKVSRGNAVSLGRIEFEGAVLLAAYYVWRPVRGDPLSVAAVRVGDGRAVVELELDLNPQGREYPYLFAPMVMVAVERGVFPAGEAVEFLFELDGEVADVVVATVD